MQVPCPVPLESPWSPVGYKVVEVRDAKLPAKQEDPQTTPPQPKPEPARVPSSPVGYRVRQVTEEERPPVKTKAAPPAARPPKTLPQRPQARTNPVALWGSIAGAGFVAVVVLMSMALGSGSRSATEKATDPANEHVRTPEGHDLIIPKGMAAKEKAPKEKASKEKGKEPAFPPDVPCKVCNPGDPARETYGTTVEFVRGPREAARIAGEEGKLTLLLHVSGNFEEAKFT